jgi:leader peptidase (prepilin peptidase)/N-methyltransferase
MPEHHILSTILHLLAGGALGLTSAGLAGHFGFRSADRLPGESRKPHCFFCLRPFKWFEIFPLFGWLLRPERFTLPCPCGRRTGLWPQPLVEIIGLLIGVTVAAVAGWSWAIVPLCLGLGLLPAMAMVDLSFGLIPDELNAALALFGFSWLEARGGDFFVGLMTVALLLGFSLLLALAYSKWRGREMLGIGDVKFFAASGFWLPPALTPWFFVAAGLIGAVTGFFWKRAGGGKEFPFAPALCLALAGCVIWQVIGQ